MQKFYGYSESSNDNIKNNKKDTLNRNLTLCSEWSSRRRRNTKFYDTLEYAIEMKNAKYLLIIGDFNSKVGERIKEDGIIMGKFGNGKKTKEEEHS